MQKNKSKKISNTLNSMLAIKLGALALAAIISVTATLSSCGNLTEDDNKPNNELEDDIDNKQDGIQDGEGNLQAPDSEEGNTQNNGTSGNTSDNNNGSSTPSNGNSESNDLKETKEEREYTAALQYVLNNSEYNALIAQRKREASDHPTISKLFDNTPYGFLEQQGYDVNAFKNETLSSYGVSFFREDEPNNLYVCVSAETNAEQPYFTQYILKYKLTDKEAEEFRWLHRENYHQAFFMVDAHSQMKTPEIVNECRITVRAHAGLRQSLATNATAKALVDEQDLYAITILNFNVEEGKAQILLIGNYSTSHTAVASALNVANITNGRRLMRVDENGAYDWCYNTGHYKLELQNNSLNCEYVLVYRNATFSDPQILHQ